MRVASWVFVACAVLGAAGMFVPAIEGAGLGGHGGQSLYRLSRDRDAFRRVLAFNRAHEVVSKRVTDTALHHQNKRAKQLHFDDARDAIATLSGISDDDVTNGTRALLALVCVFAALEVLAIVLAAPGTQGPVSRRRAIGALVVAALIACIAIAIRIGCGYALEEIDVDQLELGPGPLVTLVGALGALGAAVAVVVMQVRSRRAVPA
jgi:hypothetical protein